MSTAEELTPINAGLTEKTITHKSYSINDLCFFREFLTFYQHFGFIMDDHIGHVLCGEFGLKDPEHSDGIAEIWFDEWLEYAGDTYSWTFWCWNPNSADTGGILEYDWLTVEDWKLNKLKPYMAPLILGEEE